jgi:hypothetical protein
VLSPDLPNLVFRQRRQFTAVGLSFQFFDLVYVRITVPISKSLLVSDNIPAADKSVTLCTAAVNGLHGESKPAHAVLRANRKEMPCVVDPSAATANAPAVHSIPHPNVPIDVLLSVYAKLAQRLDPLPPLALLTPDLLRPRPPGPFKSTLSGSAYRLCGKERAEPIPAHFAATLTLGF